MRIIKSIMAVVIFCVIVGLCFVIVQLEMQKRDLVERVNSLETTLLQQHIIIKEQEEMIKKLKGESSIIHDIKEFGNNVETKAIEYGKETANFFSETFESIKSWFD